jgi:hypothetical protein
MHGLKVISLSAHSRGKKRNCKEFAREVSGCSVCVDEIAELSALRGK